MSLIRFVPIALLLGIAPLGAMTAVSPAVMPVGVHAKAAMPEQQVDAISVLTYNVKGVPWPLAIGREAAFIAIEQRLAGLRANGAQPHIMVLQEAFTDRAKEIGLRSGYAYHANGPSKDDVSDAQLTEGEEAFANNASTLKGETEGKWTDSGLQIFSDYPIVAVKRMAFGADACAGYDCLANKGALLVEVRVPGQAMPVTIVTTHLNSRRASGVGEARSLKAYQRQVGALASFVKANHNPESPLIVAGDFNASSPARRSVLASAKLVPVEGGADNSARSGLDVIRASSVLKGKLADEAAYIAGRGRDWQFFGGGSLLPTSLQIPFGREQDGSSLSDHLGFVIDYKIIQAGKVV